MYAWLWRHLPGPIMVWLVGVALLVATVVGLLFGVAFAWLDHVLGVDNAAIGQAAP